MCTCGKCICGVNQKLTKLQVKESVMKFLMGLNDSFSQVRTQILLIDPLQINKVYSLLIQEEVQRNGGSGLHARVESTALVAKGPNFIRNINSGYRSNHPQGKERPQYTHCGKLGHTTDKCYKLHGFPPGFKFKGKNPMAYQVATIDQPQESTCVPIQTQF